VTFFDGTAPLGTVNVTNMTVDQGVAQLSTAALAVGLHALSARYSGELDPSLNPTAGSTSAAVEVQINHLPGSDVSGLASLRAGRARFNAVRQRLRRSVTLVNSSGVALQGPVFLVLTGLPRKVRLRGLDGLLHRSIGGRLVLDLHLNQLAVGQSFAFTLDFTKVSSARLRFTTQLFVGTV
jgi:hypothetical protein